ncbi:MAG: UPF0175 family protein, partial [Pirellulales bacterium]
MPLTISDSLLEQAGLTVQEARLEIACRLFQTHRLSLWQAAQWTGLARGEENVRRWGHSRGWVFWRLIFTLWERSGSQARERVRPHR